MSLKGKIARCEVVIHFMKAGIIKSRAWDLKIIWAEKEVHGFNCEYNQLLKNTGTGMVVSPLKKKRGH